MRGSLVYYTEKRCLLSPSALNTTVVLCLRKIFIVLPSSSFSLPLSPNICPQADVSCLQQFIIPSGDKLRSTVCHQRVICPADIGLMFGWLVWRRIMIFFVLLCLSSKSSAATSNTNHDPHKELSPNILIFQPDDVPFYWSEAPPRLPAWPLEHVATPHIDRIQNEGISFSRAYTVSPSCAPSRYGVLTV